MCIGGPRVGPEGVEMAIIIHTADGQQHAFDSDQAARMYARRIKGGQCAYEPRRVGGRYRSGYTGGEYTVLDITMAAHRRDAMASITVQWEDGSVVTHGTAWAPREDREVLV